MELSNIQEIIRFAGYRVDGGSILDLVDVESIVAAQPKSAGYLFVLVHLKSGKVAALWESHATIADSIETLSLNDDDHDPVLNHHEKTLVLYGVK